ncbi:MAG: glycosyltransferase family 4 protein [Planctomycetota bacterium]
MKPKVAIIIERADAALGGAERSVLELSEALAALDLDVHILAAKGQADAANVHILCSDLPTKRTGYRIFTQASRKHLEENHYDIIHSVLPFDFADIYQPRGGTYPESIIRNAASYCNKLVESWKMATSFVNLRRTMLLQAEKKLCRMRNGPAIIAISHYVAEQFKRHYDVDDSRITVIPNGVRMSPPDTEKAAQLQMQIFSRLGIKKADNPVLFLFAANNFRLKGLGCLIKAMKLVSAKPAFLVVVGADKKGPYQRLATKLEIVDRVMFLGEVARIADALAVADVAVLPTFYDPCSRFILEALSAGKPVITTKFNGASEQFTNNRHGRMIDRPDDISGLAEAIAYFIEPANIQKASQAIKEDNIGQQISISRVAGQLKSVYDAMLDKRR